MPGFIEVTPTDGGQKQIINVDYIVMVLPHATGSRISLSGSVINLGGSLDPQYYALQVTEPYETVCGLLNSF
jgi:hypothetical protein